MTPPEAATIALSAEQTSSGPEGHHDPRSPQNGAQGLWCCQVQGNPTHGAVTTWHDDAPSAQAAEQAATEGGVKAVAWRVR